ncbi:MAG: hypothetical protein LBC90_02565 [Candidatus Adiutrix sp.]|jgi:hypothetical protein|nr:hypothetical protein [Candidatus Adiutrix sp.]
MKKSKNWPGDRRAFLVRLTVLAVLVAELAGCAGHLEVAPRSAEGPAMDLARGLYQRSESLRTLAARGAVSHEDGRRRTFFRFEVLILKPDRLLFTAFDPAGRPAFRLASAEGRLTGLFYGARQYFTGAATDENFARLLPIKMAQEQLVALLCGSTVRPAAAGARAVGERNTELIITPAETSEGESDVWRLKLSGGLDQDPERAVILTAARGPARRPDLTLRYLTVQDVPRENEPGLMMPFPTSMEAEWAKQFLRLTYDEVSLGPKLDPGLFTLAPPEGFEVVSLP